MMTSPTTCCTVFHDTDIDDFISRVMLSPPPPPPPPSRPPPDLSSPAPSRPSLTTPLFFTQSPQSPHQIDATTPARSLDYFQLSKSSASSQVVQPIYSRAFSDVSQVKINEHDVVDDVSGVARRVTRCSSETNEIVKDNDTVHDGLIPALAVITQSNELCYYAMKMPTPSFSRLIIAKIQKHSPQSPQQNQHQQQNLQHQQLQQQQQRQPQQQVKKDGHQQHLHQQQQQQLDQLHQQPLQQLQLLQPSSQQQPQSNSTINAVYPDPDVFLRLIKMPSETVSVIEDRTSATGSNSPFAPNNSTTNNHNNNDIVGISNSCYVNRPIDFAKLLTGLQYTTTEYQRALDVQLEEDYAKLVTPPPPPPHSSSPAPSQSTHHGVQPSALFRPANFPLPLNTTYLTDSSSETRETVCGSHVSIGNGLTGLSGSKTAQTMPTRSYDVLSDSKQAPAAITDHTKTLPVFQADCLTGKLAINRLDATGLTGSNPVIRPPSPPDTLPMSGAPNNPPLVVEVVNVCRNNEAMKDDVTMTYLHRKEAIAKALAMKTPPVVIDQHVKADTPSESGKTSECMINVSKTYNNVISAGYNENSYNVSSTNKYPNNSEHSKKSGSVIAQSEKSLVSSSTENEKNSPLSASRSSHSPPPYPPPPPPPPPPPSVLPPTLSKRVFTPVTISPSLQESATKTGNNNSATAALPPRGSSSRCYRSSVMAELTSGRHAEKFTAVEEIISSCTLSHANSNTAVSPTTLRSFCLAGSERCRAGESNIIGTDSLAQICNSMHVQEFMSGMNNTAQADVKSRANKVDSRSSAHYANGHGENFREIYNHGGENHDDGRPSRVPHSTPTSRAASPSIPRSPYSSLTRSESRGVGGGSLRGLHRRPPPTPPPRRTSYIQTSPSPSRAGSCKESSVEQQQRQRPESGNSDDMTEVREREMCISSDVVDRSKAGARMLTLFQLPGEPRNLIRHNVSASVPVNLTNPRSTLGGVTHSDLRFLVRQGQNHVYGSSLEYDDERSSKDLFTRDQRMQPIESQATTEASFKREAHEQQRLSYDEINSRHEIELSSPSRTDSVLGDENYGGRGLNDNFGRRAGSVGGGSGGGRGGGAGGGSGGGVEGNVQSSPLSSLRFKFKSFWSPSSRKRMTSSHRVSASMSMSSDEKLKTASSTSFVGGRRRKNEDVEDVGDFTFYRQNSGTRAASCEEDIKSCGNVFRTNVDDVVTFERLPSGRGVTLKYDLIGPDVGGASGNRQNGSVEHHEGGGRAKTGSMPAQNGYQGRADNSEKSTFHTFTGT